MTFFAKWGEHIPAAYDLTALRLLGSVGEPINPEAWLWYRHRISTTEVESALVSHIAVAEAAVVSASDETTGQAIVAFVILRSAAADDVDVDAMVTDLKQHVGREIGAIAKPKRILIVPELPKTRSGKIMRRLLRDVAENREIGDVATLSDTSTMRVISESVRPQEGR